MLNQAIEMAVAQHNRMISAIQRDGVTREEFFGRRQEAMISVLINDALILHSQKETQQ